MSKLTSATRTKRNVRTVDFSELEDDDESGADRYLITYADLITLLLALFIILYAISNIDAAKYEKMTTAMGSIFGSEKFKIDVNIPTQLKRGKEVAINPMEFLKSELNEIININELDRSVSIEDNQRGVTIRILDDILFVSGAADLSIRAKEVLSLVASIIKKIPNDIRVEGHTDNVQIHTAQFPSNWHLSISRALNTAYYLIETENIDPDKVSVVGYAEYNPIDDNSTPEGRAKNRRVDIIVIKNTE
ncbi:MAG: OmpA family protein [Melioribacteraceae bacterium]|nr:OmpA family protein [Melioribacteraceae bacterium]